MNGEGGFRMQFCFGEGGCAGGTMHEGQGGWVCEWGVVYGWTKMFRKTSFWYGLA